MTGVDLHLHTTYSDGRLTPTQLVRLCAKHGLKVISIADHDSIEGISEALDAARSYPRLTVIPGIELSTDASSLEIHMLGYFVDHQDTGFRLILQRFKEQRESRGRKMVEKLMELGVRISWERVEKLAGGGTVGRPHIALAMVETGYIECHREAFDRYIGRDGAAYVGRVKLTPVEAVGILIDNGALPVIAHPTYSIAKSDEESRASLKETLQELKATGLVGMEVYYGDCSPEQVSHLGGLADELGLIPCGGSDYHGFGSPGELGPGAVGPPMKSVEALKSLKRSQSRRDATPLNPTRGCW